MEYVYDSVNRVASVKRGTATITKVSGKKDREIAVTEIPALGTAYTFAQGDTNYGAGATTPLVAGITHGPAAAPVMVFGYAYDDCGNIVSETRDGLTTTYKYDKLGQLTRVNDPHENATWLYNYDRGGNILSKVKHAFTTNADPGTALDTIPYGYGDTNWKDKLTAYNGQTITYDAIGNPINDGTWTYTWGAGRQLRQLRQMSKSGMIVQFKYNHDGLRTQKTVTENGGTTTVDYTLHGKLVTHLTCGSDSLHFFYDAQCRPVKVQYNGMMYTYLHNLQGDIVGIVDNASSLVVEYKYDAWGKPIATTGSLAATLGNRNPFRYRGYVYDEETELYYLRSRYYNPLVGRFVNADSIIGEFAGLKTHNLYRYCLSDPICRSDASGNTPTDAYDFYLRAAQADGPYAVGDIICIIGALGILAYGEILKHINKSRNKTKTKTKTQAETTTAPSPTPTVSPSPTPQPQQEYFPVSPFDFHPFGLIANVYPIGANSPIVIK